MKKITRRRFDALCYARQPLIRMISKEVGWYEAFDRKLLANIVLDHIDGDYGFVILGRDSKKIFRCISISPEFHPTKEDAEKSLADHILQFKEDGHEIYPQEDEAETPNEILIPCVGEHKLHIYFKLLISEPRFEAARNLIKEIAYSFKDPDGHYIKEFQTQGFDARLWELYLYVYLYNAGFEFIHGNPSPDLHLSWFGEEYLVEAVTVNPSQNPKRPDPQPPETAEEVNELKKDYLPIKYGSSLFSKLQKKYWEKDHVIGKPLIIAIHDFHMPGSMTWSHNALCDYLYGIRVTLQKNKAGELVPTVEKIKSHSWNGKTIPSNFFHQPEAENISAILFTNSATITKFNRMGKMAGLGSKEMQFIRHGYQFDSDPDAIEPIPFSINVDDETYEESWSDSLIMFHNPNAINPVDPTHFSDISHFWWDSKEETLVGNIQPYTVISSMTTTVTSKTNSQLALDEEIQP